jgi:hypothetical protein
MSLAILTASEAVPRSPLLVNPTVYNPFSPFQLFGNGVLGMPSFVKKSQSCISKQRLCNIIGYTFDAPCQCHKSNATDIKIVYDFQYELYQLIIRLCNTGYTFDAPSC